MKPGPPKHPECHLDLFADWRDVKRPYEVACIVDAESGRTAFDDHSVKGALAKAHPDACACGADAMVIVSETIRGNSARDVSGGSVVVRAIRYTDSPPESEPPPPPPPAAAPSPLPAAAPPTADPPPPTAAPPSRTAAAPEAAVIVSTA